ncbi:hypothetical protein DB88DRAFT_491269 [Papiliotrema laurentii]|uniref:Uncharacterized protein n=1 Tax=Papiliotrema laurentii TaxID=5418 RepID=A0AAD9FPX8_PAPLA|nr:hypothetical protein DB88DRAFT_491269 [Papiliotrema laurentii]
MRGTLLSLAALSLCGIVYGQRSGLGQACDQANNHYDANTWALISNCDYQTYCADNGTCASRGCRKDIYPFGYNDVPFNELPPMCPQGQFCPDESDRCMDQVPVGGTCQKDRDDECQPPPDFKQWAGYLNVNGSICLNYTCYWANVSVGQTCVNDNTRYTAYQDNGNAYAFIVSRDNCANGLYCDAPTLQCIRQNEVGAACTAHKECISYNCESNGKCGRAADEPIHPPAYSYVLVGLGIVILIVGVMVSLWLFHRKSRKENQIRLEQYYNEQVAYRQSIMTMSNAKNSLLSLPANTRPEVAKQSLLNEDSYAYTSNLDPNGPLPPNMRRDSSAAWSEADSEVLLVDHMNKDGHPHAQSRG